MSNFIFSAVAEGGFLFHYFLEHNASDFYMRHYRDCLKNGGGTIGYLNTNYFISALGTKFLGFICLALNIRGNCAREQMFFQTYAARYHGLSRSGVNMLAAIGFMMATTTLDNIAKEYHARNRAFTKYTLSFFFVGEIV
jgi:hypothetical protein